MSFSLAPQMPVSWVAPSAPFLEDSGPKEKALGVFGKGPGCLGLAPSPELLL